MHFLLSHSKSKVGEECDNLQRAIGNIFTHSKGVVDGYLSINSLYRNTVEKALTTVDAAPLLVATTDFHKDLTSATQRFCECLTDLQSMCTVMEPVIKSSPEAGLPLMTNLYASFSRQLCTFYADLSAASSLNGKLFQKGALDIVSKQSTPPALQTAELQSEEVASSEKDAPTSTTLESSASPSKSVGAGSGPSRIGVVDGTQGSNAKGNKMLIPSEDLLDEDSHSPLEEAQNHDDSSNEGVKRRVKKKRVLKAKNSASVSHSVSSSGTHLGALQADALPIFLPVVSTIEEALGNTVRSKRPDTFSFLHQIFSKSPDLQYYLQFPMGKTVVDWVVDQYITIPSSSLSQLAHDVLPPTMPQEYEAEDEVKFGSFQGVDGPLSLLFRGNKNKTDKESSGHSRERSGEIATLSSPIPSCAWRQISRVRDPSVRMYSMFMFLEGPAPRGRFVVVHEVLWLKGGRKEEVVHVVEEVKKDLNSPKLTTETSSPRFALVSVYTSGAVHSSCSNSAASSLVKRVRRENAIQEYKEISEAEVRVETSPRMIGSSYTALLSSGGVRRAASPLDRLSPVQEPEASLTSQSSHFSPHQSLPFSPVSVQLASLDHPPLSEDSGGTAFIGAAVDMVANGVASVLTAPLTIGKAFVELTGVNESGQRYLEENLRRYFPDLDDQEILNATPCVYTSESGGNTSAVPGSFYVLPRCVCFLSSAFAGGEGKNGISDSGKVAPIQLEYEDIKEVKKCRVDRSEAIDVASHIGEGFTLSHLRDRNATYSIFVEKWLEI